MNLETPARSQSEQLRRILASRTFRNTEVLKRLLEYLGRKAVAGEADELKEYIVGVEAFGKLPEYDPKVDSIVRVQAGKLRQKLEEYYRTEGVSDSLVVEFPKGRFALRFEERHAPVVLPPEMPPQRRNVLPWILAAIASLIAIVASVAAFRSRQTLNARYENPAVRELWQPFLSNERAAIVSLGTPLFAKVAGRFFRQTALNGREELAESGEIRLLENHFSGKAAPVYVYTGIGEAAGAFELARMFTSFRKGLNLVSSNALTWEDIERNNVIFVGPPKYNQQAKDLPAPQDFSVVRGGIVNLRPRAGEPAFFGETMTADQSLVEGHALIARLPGLHDSGYTMLLASASTEGSRAAVEYVTRPDYATRLVASLRDASGAVPRYFQCVVHARFKSQTPIQIEQVALRTSVK